MNEPKRAEKPAVLLVMLPRDDGGCDLIEGTVLVSFATEAQARRFVAGASIDPSAHDRVATIPSDASGPDLQLFIKQCGARHAHAEREFYDPKLGGHGGYRNISAADWRAWDQAVARWQVERRADLAGDRDFTQR